MKNFAKKNILKKIIIVFMIITSFSFTKPKEVNAGVGGTLMAPICDLLVGLGDGAVNVIHKTLIKQDETLLRFSNVDKEWRMFATIVVGIAIGILAGALIIATAGAISAVVGAALGITLAGVGAGTVVMCSLAAGCFAGVSVYRLDLWGDELVLPLYTITPETIFTDEAGKSPEEIKDKNNDGSLFSVDFINPKKVTVKARAKKEYSIVTDKSGKKQIGNHISEKQFKDAMGMTMQEFINKSKSNKSTDSVNYSGSSRSSSWRRCNKYICRW